MKPTFDQTVSVLVKAYLNDTLVHGHPCGCAIGNLIAAKLGKKISQIDQLEFYATWGDGDNGFNWFSCLYPDRRLREGNPEKGQEQIDLLGYSMDQIMRIEKSFENTWYNAGSFRNIEEANFISLMAVVDVLADIHGMDLSQKEEAKKLFVKC